MSARAIAPTLALLDLSEWAGRTRAAASPDEAAACIASSWTRRIGEVRVDELIDELEVVAGDLQEVVERCLVEGRKGHVPTSAVAMPDTAYTSTGRLKPFNCRSPAAAAAIASSAAA